MTSFIITTVDTTTQFLTGAETGYVGPTGVLRTAGVAIATTAGATPTLSIAGHVGSDTSGAIDFGNGIGASTISIAATGEVEGMNGTALNVWTSTGLILQNAGRMYGETLGVLFTTNGAAANLTFRNSGTVIGSLGNALAAYVNGGNANITNTGTMIGGAPGIAAVYVSGNASGAVTRFTNTGTITGDLNGVAIQSDNSLFALDNAGLIVGDVLVTSTFNQFSRIENTGTIQGAIFMAPGGGEYDQTGGGTLQGFVFGGSGNNIYRTDTHLNVAEFAAGGTDRYYTSQIHTDLADEVEFLYLLAGAVSGTGNAIANTITGNGAANAIEGGIGNDTLLGGAGNDTLLGDSGIDSLNGGTGDDQMSGGASNDLLSGDTGRDSLNGGSSDDSVLGGDDDDTLRGATGNDTLHGNNDDDALFGGSGNDSLDGGSSDDTAFGGQGNDTLMGSTGQDQLTGGTGADRFVFQSLSLSTLTDPDRITDFARGSDRIDLSIIDANGLIAGSPLFAFIGAAAFTAPGQVRFVDLGANVRVEVNVVGPTGADMIINVAAPGTLTGADFFL